jgi:HD-GYP domain-containing protein (c-di-GMP phosphodiesterase class II)
VFRSAPLHDIGKIHIPDAVLNKPGKLTDEEFALMKKHTIYGGDVIEKTRPASANISFLDVAKDLATYHHEWWNGRGYPEGLKGEEIPLSARIMAVADVFDALVSKRCYKPGFGFEKSMEIIREESGTHFDPLVAGAFLNAADEVRKVLEDREREHENEEEGKKP